MGMIGADKWHRGYVQGMARDGGEVQGMRGWKGDFQWDRLDSEISIVA